MDQLTKYKLTDKEVQFLAEHFQHFVGDLQSDNGNIKIYSGTQFIDHGEMEKLLFELKQLLHSDSLVATASAFAKKYAYFIVTAGLVPISVFHKFPEFNFENVELIRSSDSPKWDPKIKFANNEVTLPGEFDSREKWLKSSYTRLFKDHVKELFEVIHDLSRLSMKVMWENLAHHTFWFYERFAKNILDDEQLKTVKEDFQYLIHKADGEMFGEEENPLSYFADLNRLPNGAPIRKYCCLTYLLNEESNNCKVCPHTNK
ncbi:MAG: hypothetical protein H0Z32_09625 [Bacillaceae bacterium]|nr:hypothetical protein [Bacillaceae bacterium]